MKRKYTCTRLVTPPHLRILARLIQEYGSLNPAECWIWPGATCGKVAHRYGNIITGSRQDGTRKVRRTHSVMYEAFVGPVHEGKELDHTCRVKLCCNPGHLEAVTHRENCRRKPREVQLVSLRAMWAARGLEVAA